MRLLDKALAASQVRHSRAIIHNEEQLEVVMAYYQGRLSAAVAARALGIDVRNAGAQLSTLLRDATSRGMIALTMTLNARADLKDNASND